MDGKALSQLVKLFSTSTIENYDVEEQIEGTTSPPESRSKIYENVQIFSDHLKTTKRFQKTFYYGDLLQSNFHPPLALTDVTLELFNRTVPNAGRLDILDMDYATSVSKAVCVSPYSMVLAMMYLEQLRHKNPDYLENVSPCDLFVVSILVASKYLFDNDEEFIYNCDWADAANIEVQDLNRQEKNFLHAMKWELFTDASDFFAYLAEVEQKIALKQISHRGWLSYTDIVVLAHNKNFTEFWWQYSKVIIKAVFVVTASYAVAVSILYGAVSISHIACVPARNFIDVFIHYGYVNTSPSLPVNLQLSEHTPGLDLNRPNVSFCCDPCISFQISDVYATGNKARCSFSKRKCLTSEHVCQHSEQITSCKDDFLLSFLGKNNVSKEKRSGILLLLLLYSDHVKWGYPTEPPNCDSVVINPTCNYSLSQA